TTAIAEGEALIGSFNMGAMLWDREDANIRVGEPQDYFTRNMVAILAEERMALTIFRPEAFVGVTFDAAPTAGV
ncbi:phage major capsid protein, partial [Priestia megaterium]